MFSSRTSKIKSNASSENALALVSISGGVRYPGTYPFFDNADISSLLKAAGGPLDSAFLKSAEFRRKASNDSSNVIEIEEIDLSNESVNIKSTLLKPYDHLHIRTVADWNEEKVITITGEVNFPGDYRISSKDNLITVIERAGGFKDTAFIKGSIYQKESVRQQENNNLKGYANSLKQTFSASSLTQDNIGLDTQELESINNLLNIIEPSGRVSINWQNEYDLENINLEDGDTLYVPQKSNYVQVLGEVNVPNVITFSENLSVQDYITLAGGLSQRADDTLYVVKADGSSIVLEKNFYSPFGKKLSIEAGDAIVVPVNIQYTDALTNWTQITQVIYQSMVSIAAVKGL